MNTDGAKKILKNLGVPPSFLDKAYNMAAPFASYIPGIDANKTKSMIDNIKGGLVENAPIPNARPTSKINVGKYPKL